MPIVLIIHYAYKLNLERINQALDHVHQLNNLYHSTIASLAMAIDAKDTKTHGHIERVQALALRLARGCGITDEMELEGLRAASLLHDVGKIAIPEYILNKPSALTKWEMEVMRKHATIGADILSSVPFPYPVVPYVRHHHEKWDGTGYPEGLRGEEIPLGARILSVADCYDALRSDRPYRPALDRDLAIGHIQTESGKAYDPAVVKVFLENVDVLEEEMRSADATAAHSLPERETETAQPRREHKERLSRTVFYEIASTQREIQALYEISGALSRSLKVSETLTLLAEKIRHLVPYTSCSIYLVNSQNDKLVSYHSAGKHAELLETLELRMGQGVTGWVAAHRQHLMNVSPAPDFMESRAFDFSYRSCLVMPLSLNDNVVGVISLYSEDAGGYTPDHLRFMESISPHAATAIRNAIIHEETQENAYTDPLTGLPNLRFFNVFMERELKRAARMDGRLTLLMMDLESFKDVNDQFGHKVGDHILTEIAHLLREQLRKSDTCVRYAGDEFIAVLPSVGKEQARHAIKRLQKVLDEHQFKVKEKVVQVGVSIGCSTYPEDARDPDLLLAIADQAMYKNKFSRQQQRQKTSNIVPFEKGAEKPS